MTENKDWFASWFDTSYYHILYKHRDYSEGQSFLKNLITFLKLEKNKVILDLACGKGRHSIYLNSLGFHVIGADLSKNSIEFAKQFETETLKFVEHDMRNPLKNKFDVILNLFTSFGFLSNNLHVELRELLSEDEGAAKTICSAIFYSNLLRVSLEQLPKTDFDRRELFLENLFFEASRLPERHKSVVIRPFVERKLPLHVFENTAEFDFSKTVSQLSTKQFYNLGFETLDCPCCAPPNAAASNLLPHSLVRVRMLSDGFFFESAFPSFSQSFHLFHPNKQSREQRRQEFGYVFPPIGPFSEGEIVEVPMADAHKLEAAGDAVWVGLSSPHWFCRLRESFLSHAFSDLNRRKLVAEEKIRLQESKALSSHNLRGFHLLGSSPAHFFDKDVAGLLAEFPPLLVLHLMDSNSGFFSLSLGETLESVRLVALDKFFEFNSKRGHKVVSPLSGSSVFVQGSSGFGLAKEFSKAHNIPSPLVRGWHFWSV